MKQYLSLLAFATLVISCNNNINGWSATDKNEFINTCVQAAIPNMGEQVAKSYCSCMQQKLEKKYPNSKDANKVTGEMQNPEMQAMVQECLGMGGNTNINKDNNNNNNPGGNPFGGNNGENNGAGWSDADNQKFMNNCITNAMNAGADRQTSTTHCQCTLEKIQKKYRSYNDADQRMTREEVNAVEQECIQERRQNGNNQ